MKKRNSYLKISILLVGLLTFSYLLEKVCDFGLQQNKNFKTSYIAERHKKADVLIHGPCEPLWMIDPELLAKKEKIQSYNLALSHSDFADNYLHLYLYLKNNEKPDLLLLYVTPESLDKRFNTFNTYRFVTYLNDSLVSAVVKENDPDYYRWSFIPFMKYAYYNKRLLFPVLQGYKHYLTKKSDAYFPSGFEPPTKRVWGNHAGEFAELYPKDFLFQVDSMRIKYLRKCIQLCQQNDIRVILYESPVLAEAIPHQTNRNELLQLIQVIAQEEGAVFINFDLPEISKKRDLYISTLNLNQDGIELFNDTLAHFLKVSAYKP